MDTFIKDKNSTFKMIINIIIALIPLILYGFYINNYLPFINKTISFMEMLRPILNIVLSSLITFLIECIIKNIKHEFNIKQCYGYFSGFMFAILLPYDIPIYILIIGSIIVGISYELLNIYKNFNFILIGYIFTILIFSSKLNVINISNTALSFKEYEKFILPISKINIFNMSINLSTILCLFSLIYLLLTKTIKWKITISYFLTNFIMYFVLCQLLKQDNNYLINVILNSSLLFSTIFLINFNTCVTPIGQVLQGMLFGILSFVFSFFFIDGNIIAILFITLFSNLLDLIGAYSRFDILKLVKWLVLIWIVIIISIMSIAINKKPYVNVNIENQN